MEEHPHIIERVHIYIQTNSLCKDRDECGRKIKPSWHMNSWSHNTDGSPANVFIPIFAKRIWLNNNVGMLLHYGLNFESFFWAWELILDKTSGTIVFLAKFNTEMRG